MERPQEIRRFAAFGIVACLVNAAATMLMMHFYLRAVAGAMVSVSIVVGLILWVLLRRSMIARVVVTIWLAFVTGSGIASYVILLALGRLATMAPGVHLSSLLTIMANIVALYFLWSPPSTAWLEKRTGNS